ncbi:MAG: HAMP domain-containing histidine kinase [Anaerolineae bacterium]|nr:HAMP domain-containing histidine kinase [Anaerolineae bacterium]
MNPFLLLVPTLLLVAAVIVGAALYRRLRKEWARNESLVGKVHETRPLEIRLDAIEALNEYAQDALILVDDRCQVVHMNGAARRVFNWETSATPDAAATLIAVTRDHEIDQVVGFALETRDENEHQLTIGTNTYRLRVCPTQIRDHTFVMLTLTDVSELRRLDRARRDMVANISHELRTPITSIRLLVDTLIRSKPDDPERGQELLGKIAAETDILNQMAQELLDLSMIESGRAEFILMPVELSTIIATSVERLAEQARRKSISIEGQSPPHLQVLADEEQIRRVLGNLLHNAVKFSPTEGLIDIAVDLLDDDVLIAVTDTGPGVTADERERVFERFYQSDRARRTGTGLGLAIAKHIVQAHGGKIWVEESPNPPGARFCFTLPLASR